MTTDFDKARKWRKMQLVCAVALVVLVVVGVFKMAAHTYRNRDNLPCIVLSLITCVAGWQACQYSRCPHCGEWLMSSWLGRDGAGRNCIRRVARGFPVVCVHCGKEVETICDCDKASDTRRKFPAEREARERG